MDAGREKVAGRGRLAAWKAIAGHGGGFLTRRFASFGPAAQAASFAALMALVGVAGVVSLAGGAASLEASAAYMASAEHGQALWQKMAFQALTIAGGQRDDRSALRASVEEFERLLSVLKTGGRALDAELPPVPARLKANLEALNRAWRPYRENLLLVAERPAGDPAVKKALAYIDLHATDGLDWDYSDYLEAAKKRRLYVQGGTIGLELLIFVLLTGLLARKSASELAPHPAEPEQANARGSPAHPGDAQIMADITGKAREAVARLEEAARDLHHERRSAAAALSSLPCAVLLADSKLKVAWANRPAAATLGVASPDELRGRFLTEIVGAEEVRGQAQAVVESGQPVEAWYLEDSAGESGPRRAFALSMQKLAPAAGGGDQVLLVLRDVSDRVREKKRAASEERQLSHVLDAALDAVLVASTSGAIAYANRAAEAMFGWNRGELIGQPVSKLMPEQFRDAHEKGLQRFAATGQGRLLGKVIRVAGLDRRGRVFPLEMTLSPVTFGGARAVVAMLRDVSASERVQQVVDRAEARFRNLSEQLPDAIVVEQEKKIVYVNPSALRLLGYREAKELVGRPLVGLIHAGDREKWKGAAARAAAAAQQSAPMEMKLITCDSATVDVEAVVLTIDFAGQSATASIFRDVRERKQLQAQLMHADRMASMGTLAAGIAHEINNPVGFVHSNLGALEKYVGRITELLDFYQGLGSREGVSGLGPVEEFLREAAEKRKQLKFDYILSDIPKLIGRSKEGTERIKKIVSDLKTFARSEEGLTEVDINQTLELALNIAWNEIKYKAEVIRDFGDIPRVRGSSTALGQLFLNILVNAAQAIPDKGTITVETRQRNGSVLVRISDTGSGIPPEHLKKIFDPFFTTKPPGKGTGLGLNIAYNIVRRHGGRIEVESRQGEGTTFTIELPQGGPR